MIFDLTTFNWDSVAAIGTCLGAIIMAILTYRIISQTNYLNQKQTEFEARINQEQLEMQKRQIRIDIFPYRRELYLNLSKVIAFSSFLTENIYTLDDLYEKSCDDIFHIYESCKDQFIGDVQKVTRSLSESEYLLSEEIIICGLDIWKAFEDVCGRFIFLESVAYSLPIDKIEETKIHNIKQIEKSCEIINSHAGTIKYKIPDELNISDLDR